MSHTPRIETLSERRCFSGVQGFYKHESKACGGTMKFSVFVPSNVSGNTKAPHLYFLAGLECTEETFPGKAGAQRMASELGMVLIACDTSPRAVRIDGDNASWDFGQGAGFYLDATRAPWSSAYNMETYLTTELRDAVEANFPVDPAKRGISGHSMGGHGALTLALKHPALYRSVSAFAPIVAPSEVPWGQKAFTGYLGDDRATWASHDACALVTAGRRTGEILIDQGESDKFLERELRPELFEAACKAANQPLRLRRHAGYDHGYYFVQTFIDDHLRFHANRLA